MEKNTLESALKEFSQTSGTNANDVKEFFALMSDGSIKRMPKEDMATVLGGLISNLKLYPYMYRGAAKDINTTMDSGFYEVAGNATANIPDGFFTYGILEVEIGQNYYIQKYHPVLKGTNTTKFGLAIRFYLNKEWTAWNYIPYNN